MHGGIRLGLVVLSAGMLMIEPAAQRPRGGGSASINPSYRADVEYDGRMTFVRLRWRSGGMSRGFWSTAWDHDYPRAEQHLSQIVRELTAMDIRLDGSRVLTLDDPELMKFPVAFMWEPGFWEMSDTEAAAFRAYLLKGGFAVFEDFDGADQWANFEAQMRRVIPEGRFVRLDRSHRIFDSFFTINDIDAIVHPMSGLSPSYLGLYEDNDPSKRLMVVANFDNDVPEYWEWSGRGLFPFANTNEAYKLGVNYLIYGTTH
ncbi:MAG: DUF4159 domain-containing protein [Vicinamibacterales bacterium]